MAGTEETKIRGTEPRENAIAILTADHKKVSEMFVQFEKLKDDDQQKQELAKAVCAELTMHAQIEEEIVYPALRDVLAEEDLIDEAEVEHGSIKKLIAALEATTPDDRFYDANMKVLSEYVEHHVTEEQNEIFPKARQVKQLDLEKMGDEIRRRKVQLREELGLGPEAPVDAGKKAENRHHSATSRHI